MSVTQSNPKAVFDALFAHAGCTPVDVPVLQEADPFLETAGEDLRRRMFMTTGSEGQELCLRPDFTIPVCLHHLAAKDSLPRRYSYFGPVFRQRFANGNAEPSEFLQTGVEDLGDHKAPLEKDADILALAIQAVRTGGYIGPLNVRLGEPGLFQALLAELGLPVDLQTRMLRNFARGHDADRLLSLLDDTRADTGALSQDILVVLGDRDALIEHIQILMESHGLSAAEGRSPECIALRLQERYGSIGIDISPDIRARAQNAIQDFLALDVHAVEVADVLTVLGNRYGVSLGDKMDAFNTRLNRLMDSSAAAELESVRFFASFARALDYYTGFVFEVGGVHAQPIAAGGRYDRLIEILGAPSQVPAVGFSLWLERLCGAEGSSNG